MEIYYRGWKRNVGLHDLCDLPLSEGRERKRFHIGEFGVSVVDYGDDEGKEVRVYWGAGDLHLGGNYLFDARFNRTDIARLFVEAFSDATVDEVLSMLADARAAKATG